VKCTRQITSSNSSMRSASVGSGSPFKMRSTFSRKARESFALYLGLSQGRGENSENDDQA